MAVTGSCLSLLNKQKLGNCTVSSFSELLEYRDYKQLLRDSCTKCVHYQLCNSNVMPTGHKEISRFVIVGNQSEHKEWRSE